MKLLPPLVGLQSAGRSSCPCIIRTAQSDSWDCNFLEGLCHASRLVCTAGAVSRSLDRSEGADECRSMAALRLPTGDWTRERVDPLAGEEAAEEGASQGVAGDRKASVQSERPEEERLEEKELTSYLSTWARMESTGSLSATCSWWLVVSLLAERLFDSVPEIGWVMVAPEDSRRGILKPIHKPLTASGKHERMWQRDYFHNLAACSV